MSDRVSLIVKFTAIEGKESDLQTALSKLITPSRGEAGNEYYDVYSTDDAKAFLVHESWIDKASFGAHTQTAGFAEFQRSLEGVLDGAYGVTHIAEVAPPSA